MPPRDTGNRPVVVRMSEELYQLVKEAAAAEERSMAAIFRRALRRYCEQVPVR
jgi:predicted HicB family RNase H-like nuclease